jgi:hypothetical protein
MALPSGSGPQPSGRGKASEAALSRASSAAGASRSPSRRRSRRLLCLKTKNAARNRHSARRFSSFPPGNSWMDIVGESRDVPWNGPEGAGGKNPCRLLPTDALRMPPIWAGRYYAIAEDFSNISTAPLAVPAGNGKPPDTRGGNRSSVRGPCPNCMGGCATIPYADHHVRFPPCQPLRDRGECWKRWLGDDFLPATGCV